jgi:hypothetical protein
VSEPLPGQLGFWEAPRQGRTGEDLRRELLASFDRGEREPTGAELRDAGVAAAARAQDKADPVWKELAYAALLRVAERQAWVHRDDVAAECGLSPHSANAWGAVWLKAVRQGVLVDRGRSRRTADPRKHAHKYTLWYSMRFKVGAPTEHEGDAA